jgi:hypothetical protein
VRLRRILDQRKSMSVRNLQQSGEVGSLAIEMHRQDRSGTGGDDALHASRIQVVRLWIDIDEDRPCPDVTDRPAGADPRERCGDHFIAWPHVARDQCQVQRGRATVDADAARDAEVLGKALLELGDRRPQGELSRFANPLDRRFDLGPDPPVLRLEIEEGDGRHRALATGSSACSRRFAAREPQPPPRSARRRA